MADTAAETTPERSARRWPYLSEEARKTVAAVLFDKILLTIILTVGTYALQKYIDARAVQQEMLRSSLAAVTSIRSDFLKEQRNALAASMMDALARIDPSRAIEVGGLGARDEIVAELNAVSRKLTLLTSMVLAGSIPVVEGWEGDGIPPIQRAVFALQQAQLDLTGAMQEFEHAIEGVLGAHPDLNARWTEPRIVSTESLMALVEPIAAGQGRISQSYTRVLSAIDMVLVEQVRLDVSAALALASSDGRPVILPPQSPR